MAKPQEDCLLTSFGSIGVDLTVPLAWFLSSGWSHYSFSSLRDPAPSEPGYPLSSVIWRKTQSASRTLVDPESRERSTTSRRS